MANELENPNYATKETAMKMLGIGHTAFDEIAPMVKGRISVKTSSGSNKYLYPIDEIKKIWTSRRQQQQLGECVKQGDKLASTKDISILGNAFMKKINDISADDDESYDKLYQSFMVMSNKVLEKVEERINKRKEREKELEEKNNELENEKQELLFLKNEGDNLYRERYEKKEIRRKINKVIRERCWKSNKSYNQYYIEMYGKYDRIHLFPYRQDYTNYLDIIQKRGHLKEFYEMILHS